MCFLGGRSSIYVYFVWGNFAGVYSLFSSNIPFVFQSRYIHCEEAAEGLPTRERLQTRCLNRVRSSGSIRESRADCYCHVKPYLLPYIYCNVLSIFPWVYTGRILFIIQHLKNCWVTVWYDTIRYICYWQCSGVTASRATWLQLMIPPCRMGGCTGFIWSRMVAVCVWRDD